MECHDRHRTTVCAAKGPCWHVKPNVVRLCVLSKGNDSIKYPTSFDRVCCTRVMMECHVDFVPPCVLLKGDDSISMPNVIQPCVQSQGDDYMPRPTSSNRVCFPRAKLDVMSDVIQPCLGYRRAMMASHARCFLTARRRSTICAIQGRRWHLMPEVVRPRVLPNGDDGIPRPTSSYRMCCPRAIDDDMPLTTSFDRLFCLMAMMA
ncbi:hypothetical protein EJD97_017488 [Solanum chilense]|uniref:Uncharacterized protein n=1 Tax=Solanum chilense TaxID=4083 RepID=A0A6N2B5P8_SOLCI|nr:hypothetical protein EJD97_017488 [Solanum chilense]